MSVVTRFSTAAAGRDLGFIPDRTTLLNRDERMLALFRFAFSEQFLQMRVKLGAVVSGPATPLGGKGPLFFLSLAATGMCRLSYSSFSM
jgi:hypothetical protein